MQPRRLGAAGWSWALFQGARDPYVILVIIYVFMPYFASRMAPSPVEGQAMAAASAKYAGWVVMATAPLFGAVIDRLGPRKPALGLIVGLMAPLIYSLWWALPDGSVLTPMQVVAITAAIAVLLAYSETLHNALLLPAAGMHKAGTASGLALAFGNGVSVVLLAFVLWAFALPGKVDWGFVPAQPLFGLSQALSEPDRLTGPLSAAVLVLLSIPLFRFVPDVPATGMKLVAAVRAGAGDLVTLVREAQGNRDALVYLGARMLFVDGLNGILVFTGVYAAGILGWGTLELLAYGLILSCFGVIGGVLAGRLDDWFGPRIALAIEIVGVIASQLMSLGMTKTSFFYAPFDPASPAAWDGPLFRTWPEIGLLLAGFLGAITVTACYSSSRTMLTRVVPREKIGVFFGLFVISGAVTAWLGPALVEWATLATGSQRWGLLPISGLLLAGLIVLLFVRGGGRAHYID